MFGKIHFRCVKDKSCISSCFSDFCASLVTPVPARYKLHTQPRYINTIPINRPTANKFYVHIKELYLKLNTKDA